VNIQLARDLAQVIFDKVPDLQAISIAENFTDYNDETSEKPEISISFEGVPDAVLDAVPEVRRLEREARSAAPVPCIDGVYAGQWEGSLDITRDKIVAELTDLEHWGVGDHYKEVIDFKTLQVREFNVPDLADENKREAFFGGFPVGVNDNDLGKKSLFLAA